MQIIFGVVLAQQIRSCVALGGKFLKIHVMPEIVFQIYHIMIWILMSNIEMHYVTLTMRKISMYQ